MLSTLIRKILPSAVDRTRKAYAAQVEQVGQFSYEIQKLTDAQLQARAAQHRASSGQAQSPNARILSLALAREAAYRVLGQRPFDVQVMAALALLDGKVAEMHTGEGKTLSAVLAAYSAAVAGGPVHVVTANEYLAGRDARTMAPVFEFLGLSTDAALPRMPQAQKQAVYACDIVYGSVSEFIFDYLKDNLVTRAEDRVRREPALVIIDEADSVLIDNARRPIVLTGPSDAPVDLMPRLSTIVPELIRQADARAPGDYWIDVPGQSAILSEAGYEKVESLLSRLQILPEGGSLYAPENAGLLYGVHAVLRAHGLFEKDRHYVVQDSQVVLINELTGRPMPDTRLEEGVHQALEAKEGLPVRPASQVYAAISVQNFFRRFPHIAGMTGTAETEALELDQVYGLKVAVLPTRLPCVRQDRDDLVFMTADEKWAAVADDIAKRHALGQPVLVGTGSIEDNDRLSARLASAGIPHRALSARNHASEAQVIADAGIPGAVTLTAGMAGRGTDIVLGGDLSGQLAALQAREDLPAAEKVALAEGAKVRWAQRHAEAVALGGLYVIGTERYESRRADNQLRGRSGRQGDPGESRFYLSLEDPLLVAFPSDAIQKMLANLRIPAGEPLEHPLVSKVISAAQRQMEARNYGLRKQMLEFDNVASMQRQTLYSQRDAILDSSDVESVVADMRHSVICAVFDTHFPEGSHEANWDVTGAEAALTEEFDLSIPIGGILASDPHLDRDTLRTRVLTAAEGAFLAKEAELGVPSMRRFEKIVLLQILDRYWHIQLANLEQLQLGIHLRSYANKDPKQEFKREAFGLFEQMLDTVSRKVTRAVYTVRVQPQQAAA